MRQGKRLSLSVDGLISDTKRFIDEKKELQDENEKLKAENVTLSSALHDARHEIRVLKNNIRTLNKIK